MIENSRRIDRVREKANKHAGFHAVLTVAAKPPFLRPRIAPLTGQRIRVRISEATAESELLVT
jgi:hypothetical protein